MQCHGPFDQGLRLVSIVHLYETTKGFTEVIRADCTGIKCCYMCRLIFYSYFFVLKTDVETNDVSHLM